MILPSIDLQQNQAVQLIRGKEFALNAGDPRPLADRFGRLGEVAVVDLDAALGCGDQRQFIRDHLLPRAPCRVGGGIRDYATACWWLDAGAPRIVVGTAADPELLRRLPRERLVVALDARDGEVVVDGWRRRTGRGIEERMAELRPYAAGFLVTFVEREGGLGGTAMDRVAALVEAAGDARLTIAGGVATVDEVAQLDALGVDAQVGMALYTGQMDLVDAFTAPLRSDREDGLWPTVVCDERGSALGLVYSDPASLRTAIDQGVGAYRSRHRGLWVKGESSGNRQRLVRIEADCDRDALRFVVEQGGTGFCHLQRQSCFSDPRLAPSPGVVRLDQQLAVRLQEARQGIAPEGSYTARLFADPEMVAAKLREECEELIEANTPEEVRHECADVLFFALARARAAGVDLAQIEAELQRRADRVQRRGGERKDLPIATAKAVASPPSGSILPRRLWQEWVNRPRQEADPTTYVEAGRIVEAVRRGGESTLRHYAMSHDDLPEGASLVIEKAELEQALQTLAVDQRALLERTAARIRSFAEQQRDRLLDFHTAVPGGQAGSRFQALSRAGCYAPGGRYPLPSSVLMTASTARAAGVHEVWVASPRPRQITLAAAALAGADGLLAAGGAQAIAALAYGAGQIPACDVVVGPGNQWVTAAKQWVAGQVAIDMPAGPTELLVCADDQAVPARVAADLLAQAEHDPQAWPVLLTDSPRLAAAVEEELIIQLEDLPAAAVARRALARGGVSILPVEAWADCISKLAPEHVALHCRNATRLAEKVRHCGAVFIGDRSAEVFGDYGAGPNHTLPTGGAGRSFGALSVLTFLRQQVWMEIEDPRSLIQDCAALARLEGLEAHARAAESRTEEASDAG